MFLFLTASFGQTQVGLTDVGYTVKSTSGDVFSERSTVGVVELGNGLYGAPLGFPGLGQYVILWDNGGTGTALRTSSNLVDFNDAGGIADFAPVLDTLAAIKREVQGLKEKNQRKTPDNSSDPARIDIAVKKDEAPDWSPANLQEEYSIDIETSNGEVRRYGG